MIDAGIPPIKLETLQTLAHAMELRGVRYKLGAKARLDTRLQSISSIDCSGYIRWLVYHSTEPSLALPDGSWMQRAFLAERLRAVAYSAAAPRKNDSTLYVAFVDPATDHTGHVWLVNDGETFECYGGRGPGSRSWNTRILRVEVGHCFVWPHVWE
jgi:hypothetical protein